MKEIINNNQNKTAMKKDYEIPLCESIELDPESNVMQTGSQYGDPGMPGSNLDLLDPLVF